MLRRLVFLSVLACLLAAAPAVGQRLIKTIPLPDSFGLPTYFCALVANTRDSVLYAGGDGTDSILVFDEVLNRPVARFGIPGPVRALHYNPPLNRLYCLGTDGHIYVVDCVTQSLIADVPGVGGSYAIMWDSLDNKLYIGAGHDTLLAFDCGRNEVVRRIPGGDPCYVPSKGQVYVLGAGDSSIVVVDCATDTVVARLDVGYRPAELTYCPGVDRVCLRSGSSWDSLVIIDPAIARVVAAREMPGACRLVGFNPTSGHLYVANSDRAGLSVVDLSGDSLVRQIPFPDSISSVYSGVYSPRDNMLYISTEDVWDGYCCVTGVVDGATDSVVAFIPAFDVADEIVLGTLPGLFYFVGDDMLHGFDAGRQVERTCLSRGFYATGATACGPTGKVYCVGSADGDQIWPSVCAVDTGGRVAPIAVEDGPRDYTAAIAANGDGSKVYFVCGWDNDAIVVVDGTADTVRSRFSLNGSATVLALGARYNKLYAAGYNSGVVSVIDGTGDSLLAEASVDGFTDDLCIVGYGAKVYAFGRGPTVFAIDGACDSVIAELEVGAGRHRLCWDTRSNRLYVANMDSSNVKAFDCATDSFIGLLHFGHPVNSLCFDSTRNRLYCTSSFPYYPGTLIAIDCAADTWKLLADDVGLVDRCSPYYDERSQLLFYPSDAGVGVVDCELDSVVASTECEESGLFPFVSAPGWNRVMVAEDGGSRLYVLSSEPRSQASIRPSVPPPVHQQTIVSGSLFVQGAQRGELFSVAGTLVARLVPGYNDVSGIRPGVYFLNRGQGYITRKIVISR